MVREELRNVRIRSTLLLAIAFALLAASVLLVSPDAQAAGATATDGWVAAPDGTKLWVTAFKPAGADAAHRVPVILDFHQWAGVRRRSIDDPVVDQLLRRGYGVVSMDQRGHGQSEGYSQFFDPTVEGHDVMSVIDAVSRIPWVQLDRPGDPRMGTIGASYGGATQLLTGLEETRLTGRTRIDAMVPEITWYDLPGSLAPSGVPKSFWMTTIWTNGARRAAPWFDQLYAYVLATGQWPPGGLAGRDPRWYEVRGIRLDVPTLFRQGTPDTLFDLNQAWHNFEGVLTPGARARSGVVAYEGGHGLPGSPWVDRCTAGGAGGGTAQAIAFFDQVLRGRGSAREVIGPRYAITTFDQRSCIRTEALDIRRPVPVGLVATPTGAGAPIQYSLLRGPARVVGVPILRGSLTTAGLDGRAFFGLSVGANPADAQLVQSNLTPIERLAPATNEPFRRELSGVAVDVPAGSTLWLTVSATAPVFAVHGSRTPGALLLGDTVVEVPVQ